MSNNKQTAVEWLIEQVNHFSWNNVIIDIPKEIIEQAKEMEKQQIMDAFKYGELPKLFRIISAEQYYNEEYRNET